MTGFGYCEICECALGEKEAEMCDCGHYACADCCEEYENIERPGTWITECTKCIEDNEPVEEERQENK